MAKTLFIGNKIAHIGQNENENKIYEVKIIGFDRLAVYVQRASGTKYYINTWEIATPQDYLNFELVK